MPQAGRSRAGFMMILDFSIDLVLDLGSTQPLTEIGTRNRPGVEGGWRITLST
jgi:hypothetical protein